MLGLVMMGRVAYVGYQQGDAGAWILGLIVTVPLFMWALKIWNRSETKSPTGIYLPIPLNKRLRNAAIYAALTVFVLWLTWHLRLGLPLAYVIPITILGGSFVVRELADTKRFVPSDALMLAREQEKVENEQKRIRAQLQDEVLLRKWWVRYLIAGGMLAAGGYLVYMDRGFWLISAVLALSAAFYAKEAALAVIGIGALVMVFYGLAALPVSVAIVLGAGIIAYAIYRARDRA